MAFRDLVMGGGGCAVPGMRPSTSNPLAGLADSLLGSTAKNQERVRELPGIGPPGEASTSAGLGHGLGPSALPGSEFDQMPFGGPQDAYAREFMGQFHGMDPAMEGAWNEAQQMRALPPIPQHHLAGPRPGMPLMERDQAAHFEQFDRIFGQGPEAMPGGQFQLPDGPSQQVLGNTLRNFFDSSRTDMPFPLMKLPELGLSHMDKVRIRDRSSIMARHVFADKGEAYVNSQVSALLQSLEIDEAGRNMGPMGGRFSEFEDYWSQATGPGGPPPARQLADQWAQEFGPRQQGGPETWADEFHKEREGQAWADEVRQNQAGQMENFPGAREQAGRTEAMAQTRRLVDTLAQDSNPKMQNSKFLQFVSKMSRGELVMEDNAVKAAPGGGGDWAQEFDQMHNRSPPDAEKWANDFAAAHMPPHSWAQEFVSGRGAGEPSADQWAEEFTSGGQWADEFGDRVASGMLGENDTDASGWLDSYNKFVQEHLQSEAQVPASQRWVYQFADSNPYVGHAAPLKEGQDLFRRGLLSEAVLALEAEVLKSADNSEAWRLLGVAHAENDDDRQAIAAMVRARDADPANLEVLLALGVSHTNELEQAEALSYLRSWLQHHPRYRTLAPHEAADHMTHQEVTALYVEAARMAPEDADVHTVLGVLFNLTREWERAIEAFRTALQLRPQDYSLWNKLGATQANSSHSAEAIEAYQRALDLKPNYVRAWSNMGIGFANQARYEESIRFYVRALAMNPSADNAWQYLRISLSCAGQTELLRACEMRQLDVFLEKFPM